MNEKRNNPAIVWYLVIIFVYTFGLGAILYFSVFSNEYSKVIELGQLLGNDTSIEIPILCSASLKSGLLDPNPIGLLSMSFLIIMAVFNYFKLGKGMRLCDYVQIFIEIEAN